MFFTKTLNKRPFLIICSISLVIILSAVFALLSTKIFADHPQFGIMDVDSGLNSRGHLGVSMAFRDKSLNSSTSVVLEIDRGNGYKEVRKIRKAPYIWGIFDPNNGDSLLTNLKDKKYKFKITVLSGSNRGVYTIRDQDAVDKITNNSLVRNSSNFVAKANDQSDSSSTNVRNAVSPLSLSLGSNSKGHIGAIAMVNNGHNIGNGTISLYISDNPNSNSRGEFVRTEGAAPYEWGYENKSQPDNDLTYLSGTYKITAVINAGRYDGQSISKNITIGSVISPAQPSEGEGGTPLELSLNNNNGYIGAVASVQRGFDIDKGTNVSLYISDNPNSDERGEFVRTEGAAPYDWGDENKGKSDKDLRVSSGTYKITAVITEGQYEGQSVSKNITIGGGSPSIPPVSNDPVDNSASCAQLNSRLGDCYTRTESDQLEAGPLIGHTSKNEVNIWALSKTKSKNNVKYQIRVNNKCLIGNMNPRSDRLGASLVKINGLCANQKYNYDILVDNKITESGSFRTAPSSKRGTFNYIPVSCVRHNFPDTGFDKVKDLEPEVLLMMGDNHYVHSTNRQTRQDANITQRSKRRSFHKVIRDTPTYATWDDHDYGRNNAHSDIPVNSGNPNSAVNRRATRTAFIDNWANPSYGQNDQGIYYDFSWGGAKFFMLDSRYFSVPARTGKESTEGKYLGGQQLNWLKDQLKAAEQAGYTFKIITAGRPFYAKKTDGTYSSGRPEVRELWEFIRSNNIRGVIFQGGDVHTNIFANHTRRRYRGEGKNAFRPLNDKNYDIYEIVSSGMAENTGDKDWAEVKVDTSPADKKDHKLTITYYSDDKKMRPINESRRTYDTSTFVLKGSDLGY